LVVNGSNFEIEFDTTFGHITRWIANGRSLVCEAGGPKLGIWRPPTCNDLTGHAIQCKKNGLDALQVINVKYDCVKFKNAVEITIKCRISPPVILSGSSVTYVYTIDDSGTLTIAVDMRPVKSHLASLPRVGLDLCLPETFNQVAWHGKGPQQNYKDNCASTRTGIFASKISNLDYLYEIPQENGNRSKVEWMSITDTYGSGLLARFKDTTFNFQASHYHPENITGAKKIYELERQPTTYLRLDYDHHGLGNASISPFVLPPYELKNEPISFSIELRTIR
jgi:hypothetical protein